MGVYLSEPNKDKKILEGCKEGVSFCSAEMQGIPSFTQVGGKIWRMLPSAPSISAMEIHCSQSSTDMEV